MAARKAREVRVIPRAGIKEQYRAFKAEYPAIAGAIKIFNDYKRDIPPRRLPDKMKDHVLQGTLDGIRECHLDDDVLLLYTHQDDLVTMLCICRHEDLYGRRGKQLATNIGRLLH